jgi:aryl-alcohol dehydrogenase-like predicted oxidoreductase
MDKVRLGPTGLHVSRVCLGMMSYGSPWVLDEAATEPIVRRAVEGGITFFDTADVHSGGAREVATGRLLPKYISRAGVVVATKVNGAMTPGPNGRGLSGKHIRAAIDASLQRLQMDYVDLYQIHRWDRAAEVAAERGAPAAQAALAWLLGKPGVTAPIVGATKLGHLEDALAAAELSLTEDEVAGLEEPYVPHPVIGHG